MKIQAIIEGHRTILIIGALCLSVAILVTAPLIKITSIAVLLAVVLAHIVALVLAFPALSLMLQSLITRRHGDPCQARVDNSLSDDGIVMHGWAPFYDLVTWLLTLGRERAFRAATLDQAQIEAGNKVLEVGCGTGTLSIAAKHRVGSTGQVHGIDAAPEMLEVARRKAGKEGIDVDFQTGLIQDIPFPDNQFDAVLSSFMIHHVPDGDVKRKGMAEIYRVLKPGGCYLVVDFEPPRNPVARVSLTLLLGHGMMQSHNQALLPMLAEAGFKGIEWAVMPVLSTFTSFSRSVKEDA